MLKSKRLTTLAKSSLQRANNLGIKCLTLMANQYVNDFTTTVKTYYEELKKCKPISRNREKELILKAKNGDIDAQNEILKANLRFVFNMAKRYKGKGATIGDLISEGNLGLIKAIERFEPERDVKFISYAVWWVRNSIQEFIKKTQRTISIEKDEDSLNSIASERRLKDCDDEYLTKKDTLAYIEDFEEGQELKRNQKKTIDLLLSKLSDRERLVIELYYGIDRDEKSHDEISQLLKITSERVRQIKQNALTKLRSEVLILEVSDLFS